MAEKKTDRSACRFTVQQARDGKPFLAVQLYRDTIPVLREVSFGFDLLRGTQVEEAKKLAEMLNEHVLDMFVKTGRKRLRHRDGAGSWNSPISALRVFGVTIEPQRVKTAADS
jgi:hypothetical protein